MFVCSLPVQKVEGVKVEGVSVSGSWPALGETGDDKRGSDGSPPTASPPDSAGEKVGGEIIDHTAELSEYDQQRYAAAGKKRGDVIPGFLMWTGILCPIALYDGS